MCIGTVKSRKYPLHIMDFLIQEVSYNNTKEWQMKKIVKYDEVDKIHEDNKKPVRMLRMAKWWWRWQG